MYPIEYLPKEKWKGTDLPVAYTSTQCYALEVQQTKEGFFVSIVKKDLKKPFTHVPEDGDYPDRLYEDWWEKAEAYGIVEDGKLLAAIELCPEEWSNRLLITELFVGEKLRKQGYGRKLIELAKNKAREGEYRVLMLETQTSNVNAVDFYLHMGFTLIGLDTCCYTNEDIARGEVRLNMGWFPEEETEK